MKMVRATAEQMATIMVAMVTVMGEPTQSEIRLPVQKKRFCSVPGDNPLTYFVKVLWQSVSTIVRNPSYMGGR